MRDPTPISALSGSGQSQTATTGRLLKSLLPRQRLPSSRSRGVCAGLQTVGGVARTGYLDCTKGILTCAMEWRRILPTLLESLFTVYGSLQPSTKRLEGSFPRSSMMQYMPPAHGAAGREVSPARL